MTLQRSGPGARLIHGLEAQETNRRRQAAHRSFSRLRGLIGRDRETDLTYLTMPDTVDPTSRALIDLVPLSLRRAGAECTPTVAIAEHLREALGPALPEVFVIHVGVDPRWLAASVPEAAARQDLGLPEDYFLFVGTRELRKDMATWRPIGW